MRAEPAVIALVVDSKNDTAASFYRRHGFKPLQSNPNRLWLTVATAAKVLAPPR
jgi:ribosomal protein S18 acetylase RimI-like enzyme